MKRWRPATSCTSTTSMDDDSTAEPMDVDAAALDAEDPLIEQLRVRVKVLEREVAHLHHLKENAHGTIQRLDAQVRMHNEALPVARELYTTTATGKTWHSRADCYHLRGTRFKNLKPCSDCTHAG